jgi:hypothetical protein
MCFFSYCYYRCVFCIFTPSVNQNDTWHCVKAMKTSLTKISSGTLHDKGKTWSFQLTDKVEPVATHVHWCIRNCDNAGCL